MQANRFFDLSTKAGGATFFWPGDVSEWNGHFFYSVVAVPHWTVPFTLKAAEFSVSTLLHSPQCHKFYVSIHTHTLTHTHIYIYSTGVLHSAIFAVKPEDSRMFLIYELHESVGLKGNYFDCTVTLPSSWPSMNQWKSSTVQTCFQVAIFPWILWCYFSTLDHHPLNNMLLCLTFSS